MDPYWHNVPPGEVWSSDADLDGTSMRDETWLQRQLPYTKLVTNATERLLRIPLAKISDELQHRGQNNRNIMSLGFDTLHVEKRRLSPMA